MKPKSIKISDYFELVKPKYVYIQVTPHKSIRNYNSSNVAKAIAHTYKSINKRIRKEQKKLFFETDFKISYVIDIDKDNANFYFLVPKPYVNIILEKIKEIWNKATVNVLDKPIKGISQECEFYQLSYKKEDALSLAVDKKSNEPLNSILSVMDIMKDDDRITLIYNFIPCSQIGWIDRYEEIMDRVKNKKSLEKTSLTPGYVFKVAVGTLLNVVDGVLEVVNDFLGGNILDEKQSLYSAVMGIIEQQREISINTKKKKEMTILPTQIGIASESIDTTRKINNAITVCQAFRTLDEDNEFKYNKCKPFKLEDSNLNTKSSILSTDEASNLIQVPGRMLLTMHRINHIKTNENKIPKELTEGIKRLGTVAYKGEKQKAYIENDYNNGNLPLIPIGSQGSGKTSYMENYSYDCVKAKEGLILIDFIKNCGLSENIKKITPSNNLIEIDLGSEQGIQGFGFNEISINKNMTTFQKLSLASLQAQQIMSLVDSISVGDALSSRMRRFLNASANIVFVQGYNSVKNVVECLENYQKREKYIDGLDIEIATHLEDEINTLKELDEYSKPTKDNPSVKCGTYSSKIEHILDRICILREDFKLKFMYNKNLSNNINLVDCMEQGKVVIIKMKESDFPTKMQKNILVTYWVSKIWLATQIRGMLHEQPLRCNILIDEIFQAPTCMKTLEYILPQSRKFGTKWVLSSQYMKQLDAIFETLEASGGSFMMLTGSTEDDFNHFKSKLTDFEYEDLRDMDKFSSLNLIKYSNGYASFITKLPPLIKDYHLGSPFLLSTLAIYLILS